MTVIHTLGWAFLACLSLTGILGYLGIHVLMREIIFIDIALAQMAAVGTITAHLALHTHEGSLLSHAAAFAVVLGAAAFYALVRRRVVQIPVEAVIGVSYAIAAAGTLFLLGVAPGGHVHLQHILAGSMLWVEWPAIATACLVFGVTGILFRVFRRPLTAISENYERAARDGLKVVWWDFLFYVLCGTVITMAVNLAGVVVVFAFLIIPATLSALFSARWGIRLVLAWAASTLASVLGLLFAYHLDFSVGPSVAMFMGLELVAAGLFSCLKKGTSNEAGGARNGHEQ